MSRDKLRPTTNFFKLKPNATRKTNGNFDRSLEGKKLGMLTVMDEYGYHEVLSKKGKLNYYTVIKCKCDCGTIKFIPRGTILSNKASCGCLGNFNDLTGQRFGKLVAIHQATSRRGRACWYCRCDCGSDKTVTSKLLITNQTKSCGCEHHKRRNFHKSWKGTEHIAHTFFSSIKKRAEFRNHEFTITIEYLEELYLSQNKKCAISGIDLFFSHVSKNKYGIQNASLDRIDSKKGYIVGNIQWVDKRVNIMKNTLSDEEFIEICTKIYKHNNEK